MRIFIRFLGGNVADTLKLEVEQSTTILDIKKKIYEETNLTANDKVTCFFRNVEITSNDISLWDLSAKQDETVTFVVEKTEGEKFHVKKPKDLGAFNNFKDEQGNFFDDALAKIFSYLPSNDIALGVELTCRKFRVVTFAYQHVVWEPTLSSLYIQHAAATRNPISLTTPTTEQKEGEEKEEEEQTTSQIAMFKTRNIEFRKVYKQTVLSKRQWQHIKELTPGQEDITELEKELGKLEFTKPRLIKLKRKPREISEEEETFLSQNDLRKLKNEIRSRSKKSKEERESDLEKYTRFKKLQKRKEELVQGTWQAVPEVLSLLTYDDLMKHSFSFRLNGLFGFYNNMGQYVIIKEDTKELVYIADLEVFGEKFRVAYIVCSEDAQQNRSDKDIAIEFFNYMELTRTKHIEEKKLIEIKLVEGGVKQLFADAIVDALISLKKYEGANQAERPRIEMKEPENSLEKKAEQQNQKQSPLARTTSSVELTESELNDPSFGRWTMQVTTFGYKEDEGIDASLDNLSEAYVAALVQALKHDSVGTLGLPLLEQVFLKKLKKEDVDTSIIGTAFAKAITKYLAETEKQRQGLQGTEEDEPVEELKAGAKGKKVKKIFKKAILVVESEEEKQLVVNNISQYYSQN
ncbi:hypothetical protein ABK040_016759 [Willaertia magna]